MAYEEYSFENTKNKLTKFWVNCAGEYAFMRRSVERLLDAYDELDHHNGTTGESIKFLENLKGHFTTAEETCIQRARSIDSE